MPSRSSTSEGWSEWQDFHLRPPGPKPGALKTELHSDEIGASDGTCTHTLPADNGLLFYSATEAKWWEMLVTLQFVTSSFLLRHPIYSRATGTSPMAALRKSWLREWESHPPEEVYEASLCALVEFPAIKNEVRRVTLPLNTACKAGASLFSHGPGNLRFTIVDLRFGRLPSCCRTA